MAEPLRALEPGARACAPNRTLEHQVLGKIALKVRKEVDRQRREPIREQKRMSRIERAAMREARREARREKVRKRIKMWQVMREAEREEERKRKEGTRFLKPETEMLKMRKCKQGAVWSVKVCKTAADPIGKIILKKSDLVVDTLVKLPKQHAFLGHDSRKLIINLVRIKQHARVRLRMKGQRATVCDRLGHLAG